MNLTSFRIILGRQVKQKWGRFLLASGGIMIGIWAITLTSSLSLGLSDTIIKAINSQPSAKEFTLYKTPTGQTNFFEISEAPTFKALGQKDFDQLKAKYPQIKDISSNNLLNAYLPAIGTNSCVDLNNANNQSILQSEAAASLSGGSATSPVGATNASSAADTIAKAEANAKNFVDKCPTLSIPAGVFQNFYENNRNSWSGKTDKPDRGEIASCFKCGSLDLNKKLGVNEPKDMIGKEIAIEYAQAPQSYEAGQEVNVLKAERGNQDITKSNIVKLKIVSVIDDRNSNSLTGGGNTNFYVDYSYFLEAIKIQKPNSSVDNLGYLQVSVVIDSYTNLDKTITSLQKDGYLPFSLTQTLITSVQTAFTALTVVLVGFGLIAMIASVFGIINVMTISVLERQKEIGILKSLGTRNSDIFYLFLVESGILGIIGWLLGTGLSLLFGLIISSIFQSFINSNAEWKSNLQALNIDTFAPSFPWWLLLGTLILSLIFTILSGVFPAIKAARQNPVDVLRSE